MTPGIADLRIEANGPSRWFERSADRRILTAAMTIAALGAVPKVALIGKDLLVAYRFGTSETLDAFLIGSLVPVTAASVLGGAFPLALIPAYVDVEIREGPAAAQQMFLRVLGWMVVLLLALSALLALLAGPILAVVAGGFPGSQRELARQILLFCLPVLFCNGLTAACSALLNALDRFALAAVCPVLTPAVTLLGLVLVKGPGIWTLVAATVGGAALEAGAVAWSVRRLVLPVLPRRESDRRAAGEVIRQYLPLLASTLLMSGTNLINQSMATRLGPHSVSALSYGAKLANLLSGVAALSLGTAVLPHFSRLVTRSAWRRIRRTVTAYGSLTAAATVPAALLVGWFSRPLAEACFERGAFLTSDTAMVARLQALFALQIPFYVLSTLGVRLLSALGRNGTVMGIAGANCVAALACNRILMPRLGASGIALSNTVVYAVSMVLVFVCLQSELRRRSLNRDDTTVLARSEEDLGILSK